MPQKGKSFNYGTSKKTPKYSESRRKTELKRVQLRAKKGRSA